MEGSVSAPAVAGDGTVYVSAGMGLYAISPPTSGGNAVLKWGYQADGVLTAPAIGDDGTVYVNDDYHMYALR
jgi:outer membrane protein assembly factor BamB